MNQNRNRPSSVDRTFKCHKCHQILDNSLKNDHLLCHMLDEDEKIRHNNRRLSQENRPNRRHNYRNRFNAPVPQNQNRNNEINDFNMRLVSELNNILSNNSLNNDGINNLNELINRENDNLHNLFVRTNSNRNRNDRNIRSFPLSFPEIVIEDINKLEEVVCLEEFKSKEKVTALPCFHYFHTNCIKKWLERKNECPICKFELTKKNIDKEGKNSFGFI